MNYFLISLRNSKRVSRTLASLQAFGIAPEVQWGVRGTSIPEELVNQMTFHHPLRDRLLRQPARGELGCSLSHYLVLNHIVKRNIQRAFIFEDDVSFTVDPTPVIQKLDSWSQDHRAFVVNWGAQRDPRFGLPISDEAYRCESPPFTLLRFPDILWGSYCLFVDRDYCIERLRNAFPIIYIFDACGMLALKSSCFALKEEIPTCAPDIPGESSTSTIEPRRPSLISRLLPRHTMARLRLERLRDLLLRGCMDERAWPLERTQAYLDHLEKLSETDFQLTG